MEKSDFFEQVFEVVKEIPEGRVTTYGAIAKLLGMPRSSRMVGYALNNSHNLTDVPAHRVVNRNGILSGKHHFSTPTEMQEKLESEGVGIANDQVVDFENLLWNPMSED